MKPAFVNGGLCNDERRSEPRNVTQTSIGGGWIQAYAQSQGLRSTWDLETWPFPFKLSWIEKELSFYLFFFLLFFDQAYWVLLVSGIKQWLKKLTNFSKSARASDHACEFEQHAGPRQGSRTNQFRINNCRCPHSRYALAPACVLRFAKQSSNLKSCTCRVAQHSTFDFGGPRVAWGQIAKHQYRSARYSEQSCADSSSLGGDSSEKELLRTNQ